MQPQWASVMLAGMVIELIAMFFFPRAYARLAFLPYDERTEPLPRPVSLSGYRGSESVPLDVASLGLDGVSYEDDDTVGGFADGRGWLRMRYKLFGWNRVMGVVSVVPRVSDDALHLTARVYPSFVLAAVPFVLGAGNPRLSAFLAVAVLVSFFVGAMMLRSRARVSLSRFQDELASRAKRHLAEQRP